MILGMVFFYIVIFGYVIVKQMRYFFNNKRINTMLLVNYIKCSDFVLLIWLEFSLINIYVANFENFVGNRLGILEIFQGDFKFPSSFLYNFPNFLLTFLTSR